MCTVVIRRRPGQPPRVLALRDEVTSRTFDDPAFWWPDQPGAYGGKDRLAGGTWCATDVPSGVTALVLNRPLSRTGAAGAPSRGVLPLLALRHGGAWPHHLDVTGMATFTVVLVTEEVTTLWDFDGTDVSSRDLTEQTHLVTSAGVADGKRARHLEAFAASEDLWDVVVDQRPANDPSALVVRHELADGAAFATVYGQLLDARPGRLDHAGSRTPWVAPWERSTVARLSR